MSLLFFPIILYWEGIEGASLQCLYYLFRLYSVGKELKGVGCLTAMSLLFFPIILCWEGIEGGPVPHCNVFIIFSDYTLLGRNCRGSGASLQFLYYFFRLYSVGKELKGVRCLTAMSLLFLPIILCSEGIEGSPVPHCNVFIIFSDYTLLGRN